MSGVAQITLTDKELGFILGWYWDSGIERGGLSPEEMVLGEKIGRLKQGVVCVPLDHDPNFP